MILSRIVLLVVAATLSCASLAQSHGPESAVTKTAAPGAALAIAWNELVLELAVAEDKLLTLKGERTAAMTHIAMHDALNAIWRRYHGYAYEHSHPDADPLAAAAQAAYSAASSTTVSSTGCARPPKSRSPRLSPPRTGSLSSCPRRL